MRKTKQLTGQGGDTEAIPTIQLPPPMEQTALHLFRARPKSTGNDTCARTNSLLQASSVVLVVDIAGMGTCKVIQAVMRGDWLDLVALNNQGEQFETCVLWHTKFDFYFGTP
jgi:hypothetical protein